MTVVMVFCFSWTVTGICKLENTVTLRDMPWHDVPCEVFVPPPLRSVFIACTKSREA